MDSPANASPVHAQVWARYRDNLPRHLIGISRQLQTEVMHALTQDKGHHALRLSFEPYIALVGQAGCRLSALADTLAVSKQACNQTANQIERAGYVERQPDPEDGRGRMLVLTARGRELVQHGADVVQKVEAHYAGLLAEGRYQALCRQLDALHRGLGMPRVRQAVVATGRSGLLSATLPRLSDYIQQRLMELTRAYGHAGLKMSHGQVLSLLGPEGGRIQQMAAIHEVSKQAISVVAKDLEQLGYILRRPDPADGRGVVLTLTVAGEQLLADTIGAVDQLEREFALLLGSAELQQMETTAQQLYRSLHLEEDVFEATDLRALARKLKQRLGEQGAQRLSQLLQTNIEAVL